MEESLKSELMARGLTEEQIAVLDGEGLDTLVALGECDASEIREVTGCNRGTAKKVMAYVKSQTAGSEPAADVTSPAVVAPPMNITVRTGNPEDMTLRELLQAVADGERSLDFTSVLRKKVRNMRVFVRLEGSDRVDVAATMELIEQDFEPGEEPTFWGTQPTETLSEILQVRKYADPLTGKQVSKGDPWLKLSEEQMAMAAYARMKGVLTGREDSYTLVAEATAAPPADRWRRVQTLWTRGVNSHDPLVMQARAAVYYVGKKERAERVEDKPRGDTAADPDFRPY